MEIHTIKMNPQFSPCEWANVPLDILNCYTVVSKGWFESAKYVFENIVFNSVNTLDHSIYRSEGSVHGHPKVKTAEWLVSDAEVIFYSSGEHIDKIIHGNSKKRILRILEDVQSLNPYLK